MRETRPSGSEGGARLNPLSLPLSVSTIWCGCRVAPHSRPSQPQRDHAPMRVRSPATRDPQSQKSEQPFSAQQTDGGTARRFQFRRLGVEAFGNDRRRCHSRGGGQSQTFDSTHVLGLARAAFGQHNRGDAADPIAPAIFRKGRPLAERRKVGELSEDEARCQTVRLPVRFRCPVAEKPRDELAL